MPQCLPKLWDSCIKSQLQVATSALIFFFSDFCYGTDSVNPFVSDYGLELMLGQNLSVILRKTTWPCFPAGRPAPPRTPGRTDLAVLVAVWDTATAQSPAAPVDPLQQAYAGMQHYTGEAL